MTFTKRNPAAGDGGARDCRARRLDTLDNSQEAPKGQPIRVELSGCYAATAEGLTVDYEKRRRGSPVCALARKLAAAGYDPASPLMIYRGETLCFKPLPLGKWAGAAVEEGDNSQKGARFRRYRPPSAQRESVDSGVGSGRFSGVSAVAGSRIPEATE